MATHHPTSTDVPVVPDPSTLTLSEAEHDGHRADPLDLTSLEHAYEEIEAARELGKAGVDAVAFADPEWLATLEVALIAIYRELCRHAPLSETVDPSSSAAERIFGGLQVVHRVTMPRSDYGVVLPLRAPDYDAPAGAGESVEASRG